MKSAAARKKPVNTSPVRLGKPRVSRREQARQSIRARLISAAMQAFAENGYRGTSRGTSIERIVEIADTTAPTFYRHFPSKRDMLAPLRERLAEEVGPVFRRLDSDQPQTLDHIRRWVRVYVNMWRRMHRLCDAHWEAVAADAKYAAETMTITLEIVDSLPALLGRYHARTREKMRLRLAMMLVFLDRVVHLARDESDEMQGEAILDQFAEMLWITLNSEDTEANVLNSEDTEANVWPSAQIPLRSAPRKL